MTTRTPPEAATHRTQRLLRMVPWLAENQGIELAAAARHLGISEAQLRRDLDLLFMCGYGSMPGEMIEVDYADGHVYVSNADTIPAPMALQRDEAVSLIVGLRSLVGLEEQADGPVHRALDKIVHATEDPQMAEIVDVVAEPGPDHLTVLRQAIAQHRRVHLRYHVPSRDETTERDVDPMRVTRSEGSWYLEGWCHSAQDTRLFHLGRILEVTVLDEDGTPPADARRHDLSAGAFSGGQYPVVTLRLERPVAWVSEYYPTEEVRDLGDGVLEVDLRASGPEWLTRLMLRLGGRARVVAPRELAEPVAAAARAALALYTEPAEDRATNAG